jgi:hypothetical protein
MSPLMTAVAAVIGNQDVFPFVDKCCAGTLHLVGSQIVHIDAEKFGLNAFPGPAFLALGVVQFDFLHPVDQLDQGVLVVGHLLETPVIECAAALQENQAIQPK